MTLVIKEVKAMKVQVFAVKLILEWTHGTHSRAQMCWLVYWLNCPPLCAVWNLNIVGTHCLTERSVRRKYIILHE